jgi:hypothetical protein
MHITGRPNHCQCLLTCRKDSLADEAFCEDHIRSCPRKSPLSGAEPRYDPYRWNKGIEIRETHNCYSYAMNVNDPKQMAKCRGKKECDAPFHQPGAASEYPPFNSNKAKTCPNLIARIKGDNPNVVMRDFEQRCPIGTSKIALVIDQSDDYHFLRQDKGGYWSQKSGARPVTDLDAGKHRIWDPQLADSNFSRHEGVLNYDVFCGYLCIPRSKTLFMHTGGGTRRASSRAGSASVGARPFRTAQTRGRS